MQINEEEKRRIIDLHFNQGKTLREVSRIMGKSSHDITPITKEHKIQLALNYAAVNGEQSDVVQLEQDRAIPNVKAYKLFDEGKSPLEVAAELNLPGDSSAARVLEFEEYAQACRHISGNSRQHGILSQIVQTRKGKRCYS